MNLFSEKPTEKKLPVFILLGPPGSGKGTQVSRLSERMGLPGISTGDLFRQNISRGTPLGQKAREYMNAGNLVPDEIVLDMLFKRISEPDCNKGFFLDGFPRTVAQADALEERTAGRVRLIVIDLQVPDEEIMTRMTGRLVCKQCSAIYHSKFSPPKHPGVCDKCGGELYQREDDKVDVIRERLNVYRRQTAPLIDYYEKKGVLHHVNGVGSPDTVFADLLAVTEGHH